jgi:hypothetical protein
MNWKLGTELRCDGNGPQADQHASLSAARNIFLGDPLKNLIGAALRNTIVYSLQMSLLPTTSTI